MCTGRWRYPAIVGGLFDFPLRPSHLIGATATSPASALSRAQGRTVSTKTRRPEVGLNSANGLDFPGMWTEREVFWTGGYPSAKRRPLLALKSRRAWVISSVGRAADS